MHPQFHRSDFTPRRRRAWRILLPLALLLSFPLAVYAAWNAPAPLLVETTGNVGAYTSLKVVNGNPAISYLDESNWDIKYVRAGNANGSTWNTPLTLDSAGQVGTDNSLSIVNGNPAISYFDNTNGDLKYVRATDADGATWGTPIAVDTGGAWQVGEYTSLAIVNGNPAISYYDISNNDLKYVRATDASGTTWGTPLVVDGLSGDVGQYTSLMIVNGNPAISYYDLGNRDLCYVRATDADGSAWGMPVIIDSAGDVGHYASLTVVNGQPAIAYRDGTNSDLKYVRALDSNGATWGTSVTLDSAGDVGGFLALAVISGQPAVSYNDSGNGDLRYIRANDANGSTWGALVTIDSLGSVGWFTSLTSVNGNPAISYQDLSSRDLKYVRANNPTLITTEKFAARSDTGPGAGWLVIGLAFVIGVSLRRARRQRATTRPPSHP
jgi:hypothetical protein